MLLQEQNALLISPGIEATACFRSTVFNRQIISFCDVEHGNVNLS